MITSKIVSEAIDYIMNHVGEKITIDDVADHCHFSKYYFSRIFKAETGESVYSFIKRAKMEQSAFRLKVDKEKTITDIGYSVGYTPSNYSSVFKQYHDTSPIEFRKGILDKSLHLDFNHDETNKLESYEECKEKITIEILEDINVIYERRIGNYHDLTLNWCEFLDKYKDYINDETLLIDRTFDDPSITDMDKCVYDVCISVKKDCSLENTLVIKGGKYAVYHFKGYIKGIYAAYQSIFTMWLPESRNEIDDRYSFAIYRRIDCETEYMEMDMCIPIK